MKKRLFLLIIALLLLLTTVSSVSAASLYKDVGDNYRYKAELDYLVKQGILLADPAKNFGVNEEITRLDIAEMLVKALKLDTNNRPDPVFTDVTSGDEMFPIISTIVDVGIMSGDENGEFKPNDYVTRAEVATILVDAFDLKGTTSTSFKDVVPTHWASEAIKILIANRITTNYPNNTYQPKEFATKEHVAIFLARILHPEFKHPAPLPEEKPEPEPEPKSCEKPSKTKTFKVNVQVTSLWEKTGMARTIDKPSISNPVDTAKWAKSMTVAQKWWLVDKIDTQALYGDEVVILKSSGSWHQIAIKDQYVPYQKEGYPGWVPKTHVTEVKADYRDCSIAIVNAKIATLFHVENKEKYMDISYSTILPVMKEEGEWLHVQTPANGVKLLRKTDAKMFKDYAAVPKPSQKDIVNSAKAFIGLPYLWAGTSAFGYDCSGIMYAVYKNHGIIIPRDSFYQATKGKAIAKKDLQPGDLMFFAGNGGKGKVYHVAMYVGDGKMLHAPNSSKKIEIISVDTSPYKKNYSGARRYLN